jgi:hypothetical protein
VILPSASKNNFVSNFAASLLFHTPSIVSAMVLIFSCVSGLFPTSTGFIASTFVAHKSPVTRVASSSFLVPRQSTLRIPFASVAVYAPISPTFPIVSILPLSENHFCASTVE